jgi:hypothetical protein
MKRSRTYNTSEVPRAVVERGQRASVGRERKLGDQKRGGSASETETETDERSSADEHADVLGRGLNGDTDKHDHGTQEDGLSSANTIAKVGRKGEGADTTDGLQKRSAPSSCCQARILT